MTNFTREQIMELIECRDNILYWASKYFFESPLTTEQVAWLDDSKQDGSNIYLGGDRNSKRTTTMLARALWEATFKFDKTTVFITHKLSQSIDHAKYVYDAVDKNTWLYPKFLQTNREYMRFENGGNIVFSHAGGKALKGRTVNLLLLDNMNIWSQADVDGVYDYLPVAKALKTTVMRSE